MALKYLNMRKNCSGVAPVRQLRPKNSHTKILWIEQGGIKNILKPDSAKEAAIHGQHGYSLLVLIYREDQILNQNVMAQSSATLHGEMKYRYLRYPNCKEFKNSPNRPLVALDNIWSKNCPSPGISELIKRQNLSCPRLWRIKTNVLFTLLGWQFPRIN